MTGRATTPLARLGGIVFVGVVVGGGSGGLSGGGLGGLILLDLYKPQILVSMLTQMMIT